MAAISFDALCGAEALAVVGVAHAGVAITLAGWKNNMKHKNGFVTLFPVFPGDRSLQIINVLCHIEGDSRTLVYYEYNMESPFLCVEHLKCCNV